MGHNPGILSEKGKEQAKKVAERLKDEKIDFIYTSDLARAKDTAKEISKFHSKAPFKVVKELRERNLGEFQGKKKSDLGWKTGEFKSTSIDPKEGESRKEFCERARNFLDKIFLKHEKETVLFVAHNGINKAIISSITGKNLEEVENQKNTAISIFKIDKDRNYKLEIFNCVKHLKDI